MYAMLTGKLPFSSHNVTTLHAMILDQQYKIPDKISDGVLPCLAFFVYSFVCPVAFLSPTPSFCCFCALVGAGADCKDLLTKLLVARPKDRITMDDLRNHPWLDLGTGLLSCALFMSSFLLSACCVCIFGCGCSCVLVFLCGCVLVWLCGY